MEADLLAVCSPIDQSGERGAAVRMRTDDVSAGGAKLRAAETPRVGDRFWVELTFARPRFLVFVEAEVVRTDASGAFAVRFDGLDEYVEQRVVRWVYAQDRRLFDRHANVRIPIPIRGRLLQARGRRGGRGVHRAVGRRLDRRRPDHLRARRPGGDRPPGGAAPGR